MEGLSTFALRLNRHLSRQPLWVLVAALTVFAVVFALGIVLPLNALIFQETLRTVIAQTTVSTAVISAPLIALSVWALRRQMIGARDLRRALDLSSRRLTEANTARTAAERATNEKSRLISNVSHELRSPLNAIVSYTELLIELAEEQGGDDMVRDLQRIESASKHLSEMVDRVFDLSKRDDQAEKIRSISVSITSLMAEVDALCRPMVAATTNRFDIRVPTDAGTVETDPLMVRQILANLVSNSAKFTENGSVTVEVTRDATGGSVGAGEAIQFTVRDSGMGVDANEIEAIFNPFTRSEEALAIPGTGLGLAISRAYARGLDGDISVQSEKGVGSAFTLTIPAAQRPPSAA